MTLHYGVRKFYFSNYLTLMFSLLCNNECINVRLAVIYITDIRNKIKNKTINTPVNRDYYIAAFLSYESKNYSDILWTDTDALS